MASTLDSLDIGQLIDERKITWFNWKLVIICFFIVVADGYDIGAAAFAGPALVKQFHVASMAAMGPVFSASLFGIFFGSLFFGWLGDRFGRKHAIIASLLVIGIFTLLCADAGSLAQLRNLRFLVGVGLGGMIPNIISLNAEYSPRNFRATLIIIMFTGITFGGAVPGPIAASLMPLYGWPIMFIIGGIAPLVMAAVSLVFLPESLKFLAVRAHRPQRVAGILQQLSPGIAVGPETRLVLPEPPVKRFHPGLLFQGGLAPLTILLWVLFVCNQLCFYFVNSWLPTVLTQANIPLADAAIATTIFQLGGTVGGLVLSRPFDRMGFAPICVLFAVAIPATVFIGYASSAEAVLMVVVGLSGFTLLGIQFGLNAASAMIYPTVFRSSGSGWAFAVGRLGSVSGPILAGYLIAMHLPIQSLFLVLGIPLAIGFLASLGMARAYLRHFHGYGLHHGDPVSQSD